MNQAMAALADRVFQATKEYCAREFSRLFESAAAPLRKRIDEMPIPIDGQPGPAGEKGDRGADGAHGADGADGAAGKSAFEIAVEAGFDGDVRRWLSSLQGAPGAVGEKGDKGDDGNDGLPGEAGPRGVDGAPGAAGERGEKGDRGERGEPGRDGANGIDGAPGPVGARGEKGETGEKGADGLDGRDGEPGRDAAHVEVLDGIDRDRRYQRGTFAAFRGGLVRSFRATDPLADGELERAGWHTIMRGIDEFAIELGADGRTLGMAVRMSDGAVVTKSVSVPTMIYRGVYRDDAGYEKGDAVTRGGSLWVLTDDAQVAAPGTPGAASGWTLAAKKGTDGRDGVRGDKGDRGAEGRAGRDLTQMGHDGSKW